MHIKKHQGFSLVEALVALLVLSIGMLGIAALYVESLRSEKTALLRTQAVTLAGDMADRIRANRSGAAGYTAAVTSANTNANCDPGGAGCTSVQIAQHEKAVWLGALANALPGGTGTIIILAAGAPNTYQITVNWTEASETSLSYRMVIQA